MPFSRVTLLTYSASYSFSHPWLERTADVVAFLLSHVRGSNADAKARERTGQDYQSFFTIPSSHSKSNIQRIIQHSSADYTSTPDRESFPRSQLRAIVL